MKLLATGTVPVLALLALLAPAGSTRVRAALEATPVSRVVSLLSDLHKRLEEELKAEEAAWKKYDCWHKTVVASKTASNTAAQSRIDSLKAYVQDIDAGKFEFTTERLDLEKQEAGIQQDLSTAASLRTEQNKDYEAAKTEMEQAVAALTDAVAVLEAAAPSAMFARRVASAGLLGMRQSLRKVLTLSRGMLSEDDARILEHELGGDVPVKDWKKLNRKATFKSKYNSRTKEIVALLKKMQSTFSQNLVDATAAEAAAKASYDKLKTSKESMLSSTQAALVALVQENGARTLTKTEAQDEIKALEDQVTSDEGFISDVNTAHSTKSSEWTDREKLRMDEITAISQAISVLHSDDARDLFKKSFKSQGYSLLQESEAQGSAVSRRQHGSLRAAAHELSSLLASSGDARLMALMARNTTSSSIAQVITKIDQLVSTLEAEETTDLQNKEDCETKRADITRQAKTHSQAMDALTEEIVRQNEKVKETEAQIAEQEKAIVDINESLVEITRQREDEARQYTADKADDMAAVGLVEQALTIITEMTKKLGGTGLLQGAAKASPVVPHNGGAGAGRPSSVAAAGEEERHAASRPAVGRVGLASVSQRLVRQPFEVQAGAAPPPPPTTWQDPTYKGASGETGGIVGIISLLRDDIQRDITSADTNEATAIQEFTKEKSDLEAAIAAANTAISDYKNVKATAEQEAITKTTERDGKKAELDSTMLELKALQPGCDFLLVNFQVRTKKRQIEIDGLKKAKAVLQGATFSN